MLFMLFLVVWWRARTHTCFSKAKLQNPSSLPFSHDLLRFVSKPSGMLCPPALR